MPEGRASPVRFSITFKLLAWCLALVCIFYLTTNFLFLSIKDIVIQSGMISSVNHEVDLAVKRLMQLLISLEENRRRYEILQRDEDLEAFIATLQSFGESLSATLAAHPEFRDPWSDLTQEYTITLSRSGAPERLFIPDQTINRWMDTLTRTRQANQQDMEHRLATLNTSARYAATAGFYGLIASLVAGLGGSAFIAFRLNRSLKEVRRGIRQLGQDSRMAPVRVLSSDELGELALAFNQMVERLRREDQMRSDFISMLNHEIRTPLTSIRESVDMVSGGVFGAVNPRQAEFLDLSLREIDRLSSLLGRLMQAARLESLRVVPKTRPLAADGIVASAVERIQPSALAKGVRLEVSQGGEQAVVLADPEYLHQTMLNLVGNAVKFSPENGVVEVGVSAAQDGGEVLFQVRDHGPGIPAGEQPLVFHKYYRAAGVRDRVDGAGLGLSIAKEIVEAHGGRIWLESEPGRGCAFFFTLPKPGEKG